MESRNIATLKLRQITFSDRYVRQLRTVQLYIHCTIVSNFSLELTSQYFSHILYSLKLVHTTGTGDRDQMLTNTFRNCINCKC